MNLDGSIPDDNPNPDNPVFAKGFRNPFGSRWRKSDKSLYVTDNGSAYYDRIAKVEAGEKLRLAQNHAAKFIILGRFK